MLSGGNVWRRDVYPLVDWAVIPLPSFQFFGGNEGFRPQLSAEFRGQVRVSKGLSFSTRIRQPVFGVFDDPGVDPADAGDPLPPVRRESARYYAGWEPKLSRLSGDYLFKLSPNTYARASAGILERAFAGVGGEVLWKPVEQNWGVGVELNYVWQRDFYSPFGFGYYDYDVVTGHASLYWDTGWYGVEAQLAAGRYLAGDWGGTLFLSPPVRQRLGGRRLRHPDRRVDRGLRRGQLRQGPAADHPAALGDAVRDPPDDRRRPAVAGERRRRLAQHRQPALSDAARPG